MSFLNTITLGYFGTPRPTPPAGAILWRETSGEFPLEKILPPGESFEGGKHFFYDARIPTVGDWKVAPVRYQHWDVARNCTYGEVLEALPEGSACRNFSALMQCVVGDIKLSEPTTLGAAIRSTLVDWGEQGTAFFVEIDGRPYILKLDYGYEFFEWFYGLRAYNPDDQVKKETRIVRLDF